jgi:hypothetical protein
VKITRTHRYWREVRGLNVPTGRNDNMLFARVLGGEEGRIRLYRCWRKDSPANESGPTQLITFELRSLEPLAVVVLMTTEQILTYRLIRSVRF